MSTAEGALAVAAGLGRGAGAAAGEPHSAASGEGAAVRCDAARGATDLSAAEPESEPPGTWILFPQPLHVALLPARPSLTTNDLPQFSQEKEIGMESLTEKPDRGG
jgi:hypothetical protein